MTDVSGVKRYGPPEPPREPGEMYAELGHTLLARGRELRERGRATAAKRRFANAAEAFKNAVRELPSVGVLHIYLAEVLEAQQRPAEALRAEVDAVRLDPSLANVALPRAERLLGPELAAPYAGLVNEWSAQPWLAVGAPGAAAAHRFLARLCDLRHDDVTAAEHWRRARETDPDDLDAAGQLGAALGRLGRHAEAADLLGGAVAAADLGADVGPRASLRLTLAEVLMASGRQCEAEAVLVAALDVNAGTRAEAELALARCQWELGRPDDALGSARDARADKNTAPSTVAEAAVLEAEILSTLGRHADAAAAAQEALHFDPTHARAIAVRVRALLDGEMDAQEALLLARAYQQRFPDDVNGQRQLVRAIRAAGRPVGELASALMRLIALTPTEEGTELRFELAEVYLNGGKADRARDTLAELAARDAEAAEDPRWSRLTSDIEVLELRREAEKLTGSADPEAAGAWAKVLARAPQDAAAHQSLAQARYAAGDLSGARAAAKQAYDLTPDYDIQVSALLLQAEILDGSDGPAAERAELRYEAARRRYWQGSHQAEARRLLEEAKELRPNDAPTLWYLADIALISSDLDAVRVDKAEVDAGLAYWAAAESIMLPDTQFSWTYLTLAGLLDQAARQPGPNHSREQWRAVAALERGLVANPAEVRCWAALAYEHGALSNYRCSLQAVETALRSDPDDIQLRTQYAATLMYMGRGDEAEQAIGRCRDESPSPNADAILAVLRMRRDDLPGALPLIQGAVSQKPDEPLFRLLLAVVLRQLGQTDEALAEFRRLWDTSQDLDEWSWLSVVANSGYELATLTMPPQADVLHRAVGLMEEQRRLAEPRLFEEPDIVANLGWLYLAAGRIDEGRECLEQALQLHTLDRGVANMVDDLKELRERSAGWADAGPLVTALDELAVAIASRRDELAAVTFTPELELARVFGAPDDEGSAVLGAEASLARLDVVAERWGRAVRRYRSLLGDAQRRFPEAVVALRRIADHYKVLGDHAFRGRDARRAMRRWQQALAVLDEPTVRTDDGLAVLQARFTFGALDIGDPAAGEHLDAAVRHLTALGEEPGRAIGGIAAGLIGGLQHYWVLDAELASIGGDAVQRDLITRVRSEFSSYLLGVLDGPRDELQPMVPATTPIILEIGSGLKAADTDTESWTLFTNYIPAMRSSIGDELGVTIPGIRVLGSDDLDVDEYVVRLDESPVTHGRVPLGMRWCLTSPAPAVAPADMIAQPDPRSGVAGWWVPADIEASLRDSGVAVEAEPLEFVIHHLEAVLRQNLARFLGVEEVENLLGQWDQDSILAGLLAEVAPDPPRRLRLGRVMRSLGAEGVPLTASRDILTAVRNAGLSDSSQHAVVQAVRRSVRRQLPGNAPDAIRVELPRTWEEELSAASTMGPVGPVLRLPPERAHALIADLQSLPEAGDPRLVVVTSAADRRLVLRQLLEDEIAVLDVLAADEVLAPGVAGVAPARVSSAIVTEPSTAARTAGPGGSAAGSVLHSPEVDPEQLKTEPPSAELLGLEGARDEG